MGKGEYIKTAAHRKKLRQALMGHPVSVEAREKMRQAATGRKLTPEHREHIRQAALARPPEITEKICQALTNPSPATIDKLRQIRRTPEYRQKMREAALRRGHGWHHTPETRERMRHAALRPEVCEKKRRARLRQRFPTRMTTIERILITEFKKRRLKFEMHKKMFGRWTPDFVFADAKLIVEADSDYWHSLPQVRTRDARLDSAAELNGWAIWHFGEQQIKTHPSACARAVARFVRDHA